MVFDVIQDLIRLGILFKITEMLRYVAAGIISNYQKHLSPHKKFCYTHQILHGGFSCSEFGFRAVIRHGVLLLFFLLLRRFSHCLEAYAIIQSNHDDKDNNYFP
jgi:putative component of membrane protein insertase Oxa1/YidC/SpoIIIJ protein YidD